jgi:hypothetical protein
MSPSTADKGNQQRCAPEIGCGRQVIGAPHQEFEIALDRCEVGTSLAGLSQSWLVRVREWLAFARHTSGVPEGGCSTVTGTGPANLPARRQLQRAGAEWADNRPAELGCYSSRKCLLCPIRPWRGRRTPLVGSSTTSPMTHVLRPCCSRIDSTRLAFDGSTRTQNPTPIL